MLDLIAREGGAGQLAALKHFDRGGAVGDLLENDLFHADLVGIVVVIILDHAQILCCAASFGECKRRSKGAGRERCRTWCRTASENSLWLGRKISVTRKDSKYGTGAVSVYWTVYSSSALTPTVSSNCGLHCFSRGPSGFLLACQVRVVESQRACRNSSPRPAITLLMMDMSLLVFLVVGHKAHAVHKVLRGDGRDLFALAVVPLGVLAQVERPDRVIVRCAPSFQPSEGTKAAEAVGLDQPVDDVGDHLLARGVRQIEGDRER